MHKPAAQSVTVLPAVAPDLGPPDGLGQVFSVALIDEAACIGCTLCIQACPVDAILGANQCMHTVITSDCTGCQSCLEPCPVDCISMVPSGQVWDQQLLKQAQQKHDARQSRLQQRHTETRGPAARTLVNKPSIATPSAQDKQQRIAQALAQARARRK